MVVEGGLAGHLDQTQLALEHGHPGALLPVVCSLLVCLHLVPGAHPDVAGLAVEFLPAVLVLAVVVVITVELGRDIVQPLGVEEPLLLRPEFPVSLLPVPELLVVELGVRPEDLTQSQSARPLPQLPVIVIVMLLS